MIGRAIWCASLVATACLSAGAAHAQLKATVLQEFEQTDGRTLQMSLVEVPPNLSGAEAPRHFHPGIEYGYILEGSIGFQTGDQPMATYNAGDSFAIPLNAPHTPKTGPKGVKMINIFLIDKNKPFATPSP